MLVLVTAIALALSWACRKKEPSEGDPGIPPAGEPDRYSATVVRIVEDGTIREVSTSRVFKSRDMLREEWTEQGLTRAMIRRPDLGKTFLLNLDSQTYQEIEIAATGPAEPRTLADANALQATDRVLDEASSPTRVETRALPDETIDGHPCSVYERRASFANGQIEITKAYSARDLAGLLLRIETNSEPGTVKVTTERRDVRLDFADDAFTVPGGYRKIEKPAEGTRTNDSLRSRAGFK
jgi:hypothetical protein